MSGRDSYNSVDEKTKPCITQNHSISDSRDNLGVNRISYESLGGILLSSIESLCEKQDCILVGFDNYDHIKTTSSDHLLDQLFLDIMEKHGIPTCELGLTINEPIADFGSFTISLDEAKAAFRRGLPKYLE